MEYVNLGATGLRVSRVCLGMMSIGNDSDKPWVIDEQAAAPIVRAAVDGGINFFDTADTYSQGASEVATGRLLGKLLTREELVIATKVFMPIRRAPAATRSATTCMTSRPTSMSSSAWSRSPASAACRRRRWRSRGCCTSPA